MHPNPKTVHTFCIPKNCSGIQKFRLNIPDPVTRDIFSALIDNRRDDQGNDLSRPAFSSTKYIKEDNYDPKLPKVISCSLDCLPEIETCKPVTGDGGAFVIVDGSESSLRSVIALGTNAQEQFILLLNFLSEQTTTFDFGISFVVEDDTFFLYMIFDDKLPINWGQLIDMGGFLFRDPNVPLRFPTTFESVTFALYSQNQDKFFLFFKMFLSFAP